MITNGSATATVETLTAEVRVLMVGNRQITLSVAKQLDWIPLPKLVPFGRVKINHDSPTVIGSDENGVLCLSHIRPVEQKRARPALSHCPGRLKPLRCIYNQPLGGGGGVADDEVALSFNEWPIALLADHMEGVHNGRKCYIANCAAPGERGCTGVHCTSSCNSWDPRDYRDEIALQVNAHIERYHEDQHRVNAARELPLIVLAGLR
jgi:hypothetical protein